MTPGPVLLGGHSYGGRQASMLAAEDPTVADALLLLSYPLHPPHKSAQLRTAHFTALRLPALFVHGTRDPFGSIEEVRAAVPSQAELLIVQGAGHDLKPVDASEAARRAVAMLRSARRPSD
jgi:predicted alpha/beta-hydrolase family hydrolase